MLPNLILPWPPIMLITDAAQANLPLDEIIRQSLNAGCRWILLRDLNADDEALMMQATRLKKLCVQYDAKLSISRNVNVAKQVKADGVHLSATQSIGDARKHCGNILLGKSCHSIQDILNVEKEGTDYVTLSPIFETASKPDYGPALGLAALKEATKQTRLPILALGGIGEEQMQYCIQAGAQGIAVMGSVMRSPSPSQTMSNLLQSGRQ